MGKNKINGVIISAPKSGSGKTLITIALMKALLLRGKKVSGFKCGPDFIDPMFHKKILGIPSKNLDLFFTDENLTRKIFCEENSGDFSVVEGVMGLYDGMSGVSLEGSTYHLAKTLQLPVILVLDCKGQARSVLAEISGFLSMDSYNLISGVIFNNMSQSLFEQIRSLVEERFSVKALGFFPTQKDLKIESRHLGLMLPDEILNLNQQIEKAAAVFEECVCLDEILSLAGDVEGYPEDGVLGDEMSAYTEDIVLSDKRSSYTEEPVLLDKRPSYPEEPVLSDKRPSHSKSLISSNKPRPKIRIAIARDEAFCFYYEDNLKLLEKLGAELVEYSPLKDKSLPSNISGIILGGGYPELYAKELSLNSQLLNQTKAALEKGMPSLAECGGFIYLHETMETADGEKFKMCGVVKGECSFQKKLVRFGYITVEEKNPRFMKNCSLKRIRGHEFHYFDSSSNGSDAVAEKPVSGKNWECAHISENHWWGFAHLYYLSNPEFAESFVRKCFEYGKDLNK